jgi:carbon monoxide dehydrogenase subunit G
MNQGMANISNQYGQQYGQTLNMEQEQVSKMADVSRDLALLKSARKSAQAEQQMQAGQQNLLATLGSGKLKKENKGLQDQLAAYQNQG